MNTLLWVLVMAAVINTLAFFINVASGRVPEMTPAGRVVDVGYTLVIGCWAFWLIAKGGAL